MVNSNSKLKGKDLQEIEQIVNQVVLYVNGYSALCKNAKAIVEPDKQVLILTLEDLRLMAKSCKQTIIIEDHSTHESLIKSLSCHCYFTVSGIKFHTYSTVEEVIKNE